MGEIPKATFDGQAPEVLEINREAMAKQFGKLGLIGGEADPIVDDVAIAEVMQRVSEVNTWKPIDDKLPFDTAFLVKTEGIPSIAIAVKRARRRWPWGKKHVRWYRQGGAVLEAKPAFYRTLQSLL